MALGRVLCRYFLSAGGIGLTCGVGMACFRFVSLIGVVTAAVADDYALVYVGSGGCDGDDHDCQEGSVAEEHIIRAIEVRPTGELLARPDIVGLDTKDMPVWLSAYETPSKHCLHVALAVSNQTLALSVDPQTGATSQAGEPVSSGGATPVFMEALPGSNVLLVADYNAPDNSNSSDGAAAATLLIAEDCSLTPGDAKAHAGHSVNPMRQGAAHVHSFVPAPYGDNKGAVYACDLGMDRIFSYDVGSDGKLSHQQETKVAAGSGPRHIVNHQDKPFLYVVSEMGMTVSVFEQVKCGEAHCLEEKQILSLVPAGKSGEGSKAAEIAILPDGSAVYATNRGLLNTVTVFEVLSDGALRQRQQIDVAPYPRGMTLAFNGSLLLVAGQRDSSVTAYHVNASGLLTPTGHSLKEGVPPHPAAFAVLPTTKTRRIVV